MHYTRIGWKSFAIVNSLTMLTTNKNFLQLGYKMQNSKLGVSINSSCCFQERIYKILVGVLGGCSLNKLNINQCDKTLDL